MVAASKISLSLASVAFGFFGLASCDNNDPVVFVHGYGGDSSHLEYKAELEASGLKVFAADVNPYASNHDRACEAFAQIKGTIVDYGACHGPDDEEKERFGADYTGKGFFEEWDENHRIHIIGHSQGGLTVRLLQRYLEQGLGCKGDTSELLTGGGKHWLTSLTTMATPQDGATSFDPDFGVGTDLIKLYSKDKPLAFPQWKLVQDTEGGETFDEFFTRLERSGLFKKKDFGIYDMSVEGVAELSSQGPSTFPGVYYFSVATERTNPEYRCDNAFNAWCYDIIEVPDPKMHEYYYETSALIGSTALPEDRENDGIVSNNRARCPTRYYNEPCIQVQDGDIDVQEWWTTGKWHFIDLDFLDHMQLVLRDSANDLSNYQNSAQRIWLELGARLKAIPSESLTIEAEAAFSNSEKAARVIQSIKTRSQMRKINVEVPFDLNKGAVAGIFFLVTGSVLMMIAFGRYFFIKRTKRFQKTDEDDIEGGPVGTKNAMFSRFKNKLNGAPVTKSQVSV